MGGRVNHKALVSTIAELSQAVAGQQKALLSLTAGNVSPAQEQLQEAFQSLQRSAAAFERFCLTCSANDGEG